MKHYHSVYSNRVNLYFHLHNNNTLEIVPSNIHAVFTKQTLK